MSKTITVANQKGGVAKTTTAVTLAHGLALQGADVLVVDVDPQGHVAPALNLIQEPCLFDLLVNLRPITNVIRQARKGLWIIPGDKRTATAQTVLVSEGAGLDALKKALRYKANTGPDYIILDTAPSVGGLQEMALWMADYVIVPSAVDFLASTGVVGLIATLQTLRFREWNGSILGILPTFYDATNESRANLAELKQTFKELVLREIRRRTILRECAAEGKTIWEFGPRTDAAEDYAALVWTVLHARA